MKTNEPINQQTEPTTALIEEIRNRLATLPPDVLERVHDALKHQPIQNAGSLLWKAGVCLCSAELYAYRKTLFPPDALVDPDTQGAPVLRNAVIQYPASGIHPPPSIVHPLPTAPSSGSLLLNDIRDLINRYVVLPETAAETLALWVVHTYAFTLRQVSTYIGVVSPEKRCGKTTLLELLGRNSLAVTG